MARDLEGQQHDQAQPSSRRRRTVVALAVAAAVTAIGVPAALAARAPAAAAQPVPQAAAARPVPSAAEVPPFEEGSPPSLPPAAELPDPPTPSVTIGGVVKGLPPAGGCPVDAPRLLAALHAGELDAGLTGARSLTDIDCYATYALARTGPVSGRRATVVFHYTGRTGTWQTIGAGTCDDVPAFARRHLERCR